MSISEASGFVAGDEDLDLHCLFGFTNTFDATVNNAATQNEDLLPCSPARPLTDLRPVGWLSPSAAGPTDGPDVVNFGDFLALDESTESPPAAAEQASSSFSSLSPPDLADCSNPHEDTASAFEPAGDFSAAETLKAAQAEIAHLKAALIADKPQQHPLTTPGDHQNSSSPRKWKSTAEEMFPPKTQTAIQMGSIETMRSLTDAEDESHALYKTLALPTTPKTFPIHLEFTRQPSAPYLSSAQDFNISSQDLQSIQNFLDPALFHVTPHHVDTSTSPSNVLMAHPVNIKAKRTPLRHAPKRSPKRATKNTTKVTKKLKATPTKTEHQRTASTTSIASPSPPIPPCHRSIDELLATNFYSLNEQEKTRVLLPLLRNLDPRVLESSLAELPCIQANGPGHGGRVARAIRKSPPTLEADNVLASKLTLGASPSPALAARTVAISSLTTSLQASPLSRKVTHVEINEEFGAMRQREALDKAALLQAQDKKR